MSYKVVIIYLTHHFRQPHYGFGWGGDIVPCLLNDILPNGRGLLAMLKAYLDRGAKSESGGVMCVTVALFNQFQYEQFLHEWQPFLDGWGAAAFHATDFYPGGGEFQRKRPDGTIDPERQARYERDSRQVPVIIGKYVRQLCVVSFRKDEFYAVAPQTWQQRFGTLNRVAAQMALTSVGFWAKRANYDGEIAYFYETGDDDEAHIHDGFVGWYSDPLLRKHARMAATPVGVPKGKARGLEVADFLAWHWNKYFVDSLTAGRRPMRKDIRALMELLKIRDESKIDVRPFMGRVLVDFLVAQGCKRVKPSSGAAV